MAWKAVEPRDVLHHVRVFLGRRPRCMHKNAKSMPALRMVKASKINRQSLLEQHPDSVLKLGNFVNATTDPL
ncbi:hypothetical protein MA20_07715 [Bradyrhizobium japonicum]|uniref:Uncharacterized protein n=1 Tax=Bradyrhizobium japonicum TaxID=375 RepID=A0A0A3Y1A4_BRAJP|nr:hypothetical protein MA20_07715 [Bradyrhizobium japonicum]